jgi:hypothetical protein
MKRRTSLKIVAVYFAVAAAAVVAVNVLANLARSDPSFTWMFELSKSITSWIFFLFVFAVGPALLSLSVMATMRFHPYGYFQLKRSIIRPLLWDEIWDDEAGKRKRRKWLEEAD